MAVAISGFEVGLAELPPQCPVPVDPPLADDEQRGIVDIPVGQNQVALTFNPPFGVPPYPPTGIVLKPDPAGDDIFVLTVASLTGASCIVFFSSPAPAAGYQYSFRVAPRV